METDEEAKETETKEKETKKEEVTPQVKKELVSCSFILWFYLVPQKYLHSQHLHARGTGIVTRILHVSFIPTAFSPRGGPMSPQKK